MNPLLTETKKDKQKELHTHGWHGILFAWNNRVTGWLTSILHRMGVVLMKNKFSFNDLIQFGLFILALLTFIYLTCH